MASKKITPRRDSQPSAKSGKSQPKITAPGSKAATQTGSNSGIRVNSRPKSQASPGFPGKPGGTLSHKTPPASIKKSQPVQIRNGLSLDRKLDIIGIVMALAGLLTFLSMISPIQGTLMGSWVSALLLAFGWGAYLFPLLLIGLGLWLVLRNFERIPQLAVERLIGFVLLYFNLLAVVHFFLVLSTGQEALDLASESLGGGYSGGVVVGFLLAALGPAGAAIALAAWMVIALALSLDITVAEMFKSVTSAFERLSDWFTDTIFARRHPENHPSVSTQGLQDYKPTARISTPPSATQSGLMETNPELLSAPTDFGE